MKETKKVSHTPGPWTDNIAGIWREEGVQVYDSCRQVVAIACHVSEIIPDAPSNEESQANAKLIAAAPEMLEALIKVNHAIQSSNMKGTILHDEVRNAIKKAIE